MIQPRLSQVFIFSFLLSSVSLAGNPIRGFVEDASSREPLPAVNILIEGTNTGSSTNLDGYFVIDGLNPGVYSLLISCMGYYPHREQVVVANEVMEPLRIELTPGIFKLEDVVVELEEESGLSARVSPIVSNVPINVTTIKRMPSMLAETDVLRAIQAIPGVKASSEISSGIYVRGGSPDQTLILMDHNVVYNPSHLFGIFSTFNADAVKHIDLLKGGFPARYGGRSGSVLEVITNEGNRKETEGMASIGIISARAVLEGPLPKGKGSYAFSGRRTYFDGIMAYYRNKDPDLDLPVYYFYDGNGKLNFDLSNKTTLSLAGYWGEDILDLEAGPEETRIKLNLTWGNRTFNSRLRHVLSRNLFLTVNASVSRYRSQHGIDYDGIEISESFDRLMDYSLKSDLEYSGKSGHRLRTGAAVNRYDFTLRIENFSVSEIDADEISYCYTWYAEDQWRISPLFEIQPGLRTYYYDRGDYFRIDPRLAFVYYYDAGLRFKIAGGRYSQFINLLNFGEGMSNFDIWVPLDETIEPSYSDQIVLGLEWEPKNDLEFTAETYFTGMNNIVELNRVITDQVDNTNQAFLPGGEGYAYGFEWMLRRKEGRLTGWFGYSLSWTQRRFHETYQNNGDWYYPVWDRRHDFITTCNYALNKRWDLSAAWRYNTGQGYTQPVGVYAMHYSTYGFDRQVMYGGLNNYRFPADHRLDLTAAYKHKFWGGLPATLNLSIYNVYSRRCYYRRFIDTGANPVEIEDVKLLPMLPMVSYEVRF